MNEISERCQELTEQEMARINGGNVVLGILGGILANFIHDALTGADGGGFVGQVTNAMKGILNGR